MWVTRNKMAEAVWSIEYVGRAVIFRRRASEASKHAIAVKRW